MQVVMPQRVPVVATESEIVVEPEPVILAELVEFLDERIIPRLPASCEWKWVLLKLRRALAPRRA